MSVSVTIYLTNADYRALVKVADRHGARAHTLIEHLVDRALHGEAAKPTPAPKPVTPRSKPKAAFMVERYETVTALHAKGMNDVVIGALMNLHPNSIFEARRTLGLPANSKGGRRPKNTTKESTE